MKNIVGRIAKWELLEKKLVIFVLVLALIMLMIKSMFRIASHGKFIRGICMSQRKISLVLDFYK